MLSIKDFTNTLKVKIDGWQTARTEIALAAAFDASSAIVNRVIETGTNDDGGTFGIYADSTQKTKVKKGRTGSPFPSINFSDTNIMWRTTLPVIESETINSVTIVIKPTREDREEILGYHEDTFGSIIKANAQEKQDLIEDYSNRLNDFWL